MGQININNEIYGSNKSEDIIYNDITVKEKLDTIPVFDINDNSNVTNEINDYLTYGHIVDTLTSNDSNKVLSAKQGKILNEKFNNIDFSALEDNITANTKSIDNLNTNITSLTGKVNTHYMTLSDNIDTNSNNINKLNNKIPFSFGVDANGNYGYIKDGADTVIPFKTNKIPNIYTTECTWPASSYLSISVPFKPDIFIATCRVQDTLVFTTNIDEINKEYNTGNNCFYYYKGSKYANYTWDYVNGVLNIKVAITSMSLYTNLVCIKF